MINSIVILLILITSFSLEAKKSVLAPRGIIDVRNGNLIQAKYIYIDNGKIKELSNSLKSGFELIELKNLFLMPGLIDCHAHLFITQNPLKENFVEAVISNNQMTSEFKIERAKKFLRDYLRAGFTGVCDLGNSGQFLDVKLRNEIKNDPNYPDYYVSGPGLAMGQAQLLLNTPKKILESEYSIVNNKTDIERMLEKYVDQNVDILKIILDGPTDSANFSEKKLLEIMHSPSIKKFKKVTFHVTSPKSYDLIKKLKIKNVEHLLAYDDDNNVQYFSDSVIGIEQLKKLHLYNPVNELIRKNLIKYSITKNKRLIFGPDYYYVSDSLNFNRANEIRQTIFTLSEYGLSNLKIIQSLTINPMLSFNIYNESEGLHAGITANIIGFENNPLIDLKSLNRPKFIMKSGSIILNN